MAETLKTTEVHRADVAHIGKSVLVKGELSGSEDLYLDGEVEGTIELAGHSMTVGPNGRLRAHINARDVVVHGRVEGNIHGSARVELKKTATVSGDIITPSVVIEEGAFFKGSIDIQRDGGKSETARRDSALGSPAPVEAVGRSTSK